MTGMTTPPPSLIAEHTTNAGSVRPGDVVLIGSRRRLVLDVSDDGTRVAMATAPAGSPVLPTNVTAHVLPTTATVALVR